MENIDRVEQNVITSFRLAKSDIIRLQDRFMELKNSHVKILERLANLENEMAKPRQPITIIRRERAVAKTAPVKTKTRTITKIKVVRAKAKVVRQTYVASKDGKKFHDPGCVSLKKVPSNKWVIYHSKKKAMAKGLKPCGTCIPR